MALLSHPKRKGPVPKRSDDDARVFTAVKQQSINHPYGRMHCPTLSGVFADSFTTLNLLPYNPNKAQAPFLAICHLPAVDEDVVAAGGARDG
jgi:hypothetical protein